MSTIASEKGSSNRLVIGFSDIGWLLILSVLWGASFFFVKIVLTDLPLLTLVFLRIGIGGGVLLAVLWALNFPIPSSLKIWRNLLLLGLISNVMPFVFMFWGQSKMPQGISASLAAILNGMTPLLSLILAHIYTTDERLTFSKAFGISLGFLGVLCVIAPTFQPESVRLHLSLMEHMLGIGACLMASICYACVGVFGRNFNKMGVKPPVAAAGQLVMGALVLLPFVLFLDQPWTLPFPKGASIASVIGLALGSTSCGFVIYFHLLNRIGAVNASLVTYLVPITAIFLSYMFLGERLVKLHFVGLGFILVGVLVMDERIRIWQKK